jgi:hypothetical protein
MDGQGRRMPERFSGMGELRQCNKPLRRAPVPYVRFVYDGYKSLRLKRRADIPAQPFKVK